MKAHERYLALTALGSSVFALGVLIGFGYLSSVFVSPHGASDIAFESPLLPNGWQTYRGDGWSVGYSGEYVPQERPERATVYFIPEDYDVGRIYFSVQRRESSLQQEVRARETQGYADPDSIMFANYSARKYTATDGRVEIVIDRDDEVIFLVADDPEDVDIAPMFATFTFTE